jgi:hypothetical protein
MEGRREDVPGHDDQWIPECFHGVLASGSHGACQRTYYHWFVHSFFSLHIDFSLQTLIVVIECQADLIRDVIVSIRKQNLRSVEPKVEAQEKWKADLNEMIKYTLFQHTGKAS